MPPTAQTVVIPAGAHGRDYAYFRPSSTWLVTNGVKFVSRYLAKLPNAKVINAAEVAHLHAARVGIILNWEQSAGDPLKGATVGADHGRRAKAQAEALGYPHACPIVFSVDVGVLTSQRPLVEGYLRAAATAIYPYPLGVYGGTTVIDWMGDLCELGWQANARSWSPKPSLNVHIKQHTQAPDHLTDPNTAVRPFLAWLAGGSPVVVTPPPVPEVVVPPRYDGGQVPQITVTEDEDMAQFIADSETMGSALISFLTTKDNTAGYRMAGFNTADERRMAEIDARLPVVKMTDDQYRARAAGSYRG